MKDLVESASHGTLFQVPDVYYGMGSSVDRRHPLTLQRLGAPRGAPGVGHLYALFSEAHQDSMMRRRVCETGGGGYTEVEYICTHLSTLFQSVPGCTKMPPGDFAVSPSKRNARFSARRNKNRSVVLCALFFACIMAHWIKENTTSPLRTSLVSARAWSSRPWPRCGRMLPGRLLGGGGMARRPGKRPSTKPDAVCREVATMVEARTNKPLLVPLS